MDEVNVNEGIVTEEAPAEQDEFAILPDGWDGEGDFFDDASWTDTETSESNTDASIDSTQTSDPTTVDATEEKTPVADGTPTIDDSETSTETPHKLKFTAKVDHNDLDVELDEADLPGIYQKAQVVDRVQSQMGKMKGTIDRATLLAKGMGFANPDDMLIAAAKNHLQNEIDRLVNDAEHPVHPDVARDIMERRLGYTMDSLDEAMSIPSEVPTSDAQPTAQTPSQGRNIASEVQELLSAHPELIGKELPDEVARQAIQSGERLIDVYRRFDQNKQAEKMKDLVKENQVLKQNAETAKRAPVHGVTGNGIEGNEPEDPFLAGFNSDPW